MNIGIGLFAPLPAYTFSAPPELVVIPGTYVYYAPDGGTSGKELTKERSRETGERSSRAREVKRGEREIQREALY